MLKQFLREEEGQTTVEYILIVGLVVVIIGIFGKVITKQLPSTIDSVFAGVNGKIKELMGSSR